MKKTKPTTQGGKRKGAGRPKNRYPSTMVFARMNKPLTDRIAAFARSRDLLQNQSEAIRRLVMMGLDDAGF